LARALIRTRARRIALIAVGVLLFLAVSGVLARFLSVENEERDDILAVLQAQAAGNAQGVLAGLDGCAASAACTAVAHANATQLRRRGAVKILTLTSATAYSLTGATGRTRVAWTVIGRLPVVQCVLVRRTGNALSGISLALLSISAPISNEGDC
jgi:hypothetical protein